MIDECQDLLTREQEDLAESPLSNFIPDFAKSKDDFSQTSVVHHGMTMLSKERVKMRPRQLVLAKREALKLELKRLLKLGVIEPSRSCWASPVVLVTKKDGSIRLCVNYHRVNDLTLKDSYPLPRIDDSIDTLRGSKWFSTWDLASGYWQVPMDSKDIDKTAFTTPFGLYHFTVMPFGLANAPATFERMMEQVLSGLHWEISLINIDDIIVFSRTFEEHLVRLHQVLSRIKEANLKLSPSKCKLFRHSVEYLGHVVSQDGVGTDPKKIRGHHWMARTTQHQRCEELCGPLFLLSPVCSWFCWHSEASPSDCGPRWLSVEWWVCESFCNTSKKLLLLLKYLAIRQMRGSLCWIRMLVAMG